MTPLRQRLNVIVLVGALSIGLATPPVAALAVAAPRSSTALGGIEGTVRSVTGPTGLSGVCVEASTSSFHRQTTTGKSGSYLLSGLPAGRYAIRFTPTCGNNGNYLPYAPVGTVAVLTNKITKNINGALATGGWVTGTVASSRGPVVGLCVGGTGKALSVSTTTTKAGQFKLARLTTGTYTLTFAGCGTKGSLGYTKVVYTGVVVHAGVASNNGATTVVKAIGSTTGIVTGVVTSAGPKHQPLGHACIDVNYSRYQATLTAPDGTYEVVGLAPGTNSVTAEGYPLLGCVTSADPWGYDAIVLTGITVTAGKAVSGKDAALPPWGAISGTITGSSANATSHGPLARCSASVPGLTLNQA